MYYPVQIPYILNPKFKHSIDYTEEKYRTFSETIICFWKMKSINNESKDEANNIIVPDGCIDLIIDYSSKQIGLSGMSKTEFNFKIKENSSYFGVRFFPGTIFSLFGVSCEEIMDKFIPIQSVENKFNINKFFSLKIEESYAYIKNYIKEKEIQHQKFYYKDVFLKLYNEESSLSVNKIAKLLDISTRQLYRIFLKEYGISPSMMLSVIRFQKSLNHLIENKGNMSLVDSSSYYYDQPHFNKDIKKNIGITPLNLIKTYIKV